VHARVQGQDLAYPSGNPLEGGCARRVVKVRVGAGRAVDQRHAGGSSYDGEQGVERGGAGSVVGACLDGRGAFCGNGHGSPLVASRDHLDGPALAQADWPEPGRHPGHPTAEGGLPASKPGLRAGTRDLTQGSTTRAAVSIFPAPVSLGGPAVKRCTARTTHRRPRQANGTTQEFLRASWPWLRR
jgi:hypothetical protein